MCLWPRQRIQDMEERRIERVCEAMRLSAEAERKVLPVVSRCLDAMMDAAESIQPRMVSFLSHDLRLRTGLTSCLAY